MLYRILYTYRMITLKSECQHFYMMNLRSKTVKKNLLHLT